MVDIIPDPNNLPVEAMPWARAVTKLLLSVVSNSSSSQQRAGNIIQQLQATVQSLSNNVSNLTTKFNTAISSITFDAGQVVSGVLNIARIPTIPAGQVSGTVTNVVNSSAVTSAAAFVSMGSYNYRVSTGYQGMWINGDGTIGISASNLESKKDLELLVNIDPLMSLKPRLGRYKWDASTEVKKQFLIAEEVFDAGFGPDVAPLDKDGHPISINYSQLVPALIATIQSLDKRIRVLEATSPNAIPSSNRITADVSVSTTATISTTTP